MPRMHEHDAAARAIPFWYCSVLLWVLFDAFVLLYEEPALRAQFGASYDAYRQNVRRWRPRLRPWSS